MSAILVSSFAGYVGGGTSTCQYSVTVPPMGSHGLIIVAFMGREQTGDHDPEHVNGADIGGVPMTVIADTGVEETAGGAYVIQGLDCPPAGNYTMTNHYKGSNWAEHHRTVLAFFRKVRDVPVEASNTHTTNIGGVNQVTVQPLTQNALIIATHWWRVGFAEGTPSSDFIHVNTSRGDNTAGQSMYYKNQLVPVSTTFRIDAGNTEQQAFYIFSFDTRVPEPGIQIMGG